MSFRILWLRVKLYTVPLFSIFENGLFTDEQIYFNKSNCKKYTNLDVRANIFIFKKSQGP